MLYIDGEYRIFCAVYIG